MTKGKLYLVATPIGNMEDITLRAIRTLKEVDIIACEDTRHSLPLLTHYEIKKPLVSYYKQKEQEGSEYILSKLEEGQNVALISDAGMCCISDPGAVLVQKAWENGYEVTVVPGPSAVVSAFALSGITESTGFCFLGFLPQQLKARKTLLAKYKNVDVPLVFYESPHDILKDCEFLLEELGDRGIVIVKEITKIYEKVIKCKLSSVEIENVKGEFVLIVKPREQGYEMSIEEHLMGYIDAGMDKKSAVKQVAKDRNIPKNEVYQVALKL